jgi:hypothetical protein
MSYKFDIFSVGIPFFRRVLRAVYTLLSPSAGYYQSILPIDPSGLMSMIGPEGTMNKEELTKIAHAMKKGLADIGAALEEANNISRDQFIGNGNDTRYIFVISKISRAGSVRV